MGQQQEKNNPANSANKDRAGIGQTDEEKGISSKEEQKEKQEELEKKGKAKRRPQFNGEPDDETSEEKPLQLEP